MQMLQRLAKAGSLAALAHEMAATAAGITRADAILVASGGPNSGLRILGVAGRQPPDEEPQQTLSLSGWVLQTGEFAHCADVATDPRGAFAKQLGFHTGSVLAMPVRPSGKAVLVITLYSSQDGGHLLLHMDALQALCESAAVALELLELRQTAQRQTRHILALHELSRLLVLPLEPAAVLSLGIDIAMGLFDLQLCCALLADSGGALRVAAARGLAPGDAECLVQPNTEKPDLNPLVREGLALQQWPLTGRFGRHGHLVIGRKGDPLTPEEAKLLQVWTYLAGTMLDNARLTARAEPADDQGLAAMTAAVEMVAAGSRNLAQGTAQLAEALSRCFTDGQVRRTALESIAGPQPGPAPVPDEPQPELSTLTEREREILTLIAQGASNREIAAALFLSAATVKTHVSRILQKLHLPDRTKAAVYLMRGQRPSAAP